MSASVLLVEDEPAIADAVAYALRNEGFDVDETATGEDAIAAAGTRDYDVVVLDLMLPGIPGIEVCRQLRRDSTVPVIMLTAKDSELDRVLGLEVGADDYVTKPFSVNELVARVRALLRRVDLDRRSPAAGVRTVGDLRLDLGRHRVDVAGEPVHLTRAEFRLLALLATEPERVFTRREIMEHLWQSSYVGDERACDIHISNVRRKIEDDPRKPERLVTVRGVGYALAPYVSVSTHNS